MGKWLGPPTQPRLNLRTIKPQQDGQLTVEYIQKRYMRGIVHFTVQCTVRRNTFALGSSVCILYGRPCAGSNSSHMAG